MCGNALRRRVLFGHLPVARVAAETAVAVKSCWIKSWEFRVQIGFRTVENGALKL